MKKNNFFSIALVVCLFSTDVLAQPGSCTETLNFNWLNSSGTGAVWPITNGESSITRNYAVMGVSATVAVDVTLSNPDKNNIDFSNCGTAGNHFYTATNADPNAAQDCGPGTDGQFSYGYDYLTFGITSANSNEKVSITFNFSYPTRISDFSIWDIDFQGSSSGTAGSWQDEVDVSAKFIGTPVNISAYNIGSAVTVTGNGTTALNVLSL